MENSSKAGVAMMNGVESRGAKQRGVRSIELVLRALALVLTLAAAITLGVNKQTKLVPVKVVDSLPPINVPAQAKMHYLSAFVYSVVADAIACAYAAFSLLLLMAGKKGLVPIVIILDTVMVALLFSSVGAGGAIGLMGKQGNSRVRWDKVCNVFGKFCNQTVASLGLSLLGSIAFLLLVALSVLRLHKNSH